MHMYKARSDLMQTHRHTNTLYLPINILIMRYPTITSSGGIQGPSVSAHKNAHTLFLALSLSLVYPVISVNKRQTLLCSDRAGRGGGVAFHCFKSGKMLPSDEWGFLELRAMKLYALSFTGLFFTLLLWKHTQPFLSFYPIPLFLPFSLRFHPLFYLRSFPLTETGGLDLCPNCFPAYSLTHKRMPELIRCVSVVLVNQFPL